MFSEPELGQDVLQAPATAMPELHHEIQKALHRPELEDHDRHTHQAQPDPEEELHHFLHASSHLLVHAPCKRPQQVESDQQWETQTENSHSNSQIVATLGEPKHGCSSSMRSAGGFVCRRVRSATLPVPVGS